LPAGPDCLAEYATVPIGFEVRALLRPVLLGEGLGGIALRRETLHSPFLKDYDASEEGGPERWADTWDLSSWGFFLARQAGRCVGAAAVPLACGARRGPATAVAIMTTSNWNYPAGWPQPMTGFTVLP